jgi:hypothetical protein
MLFKEVCHRIGEIRVVIWVNPASNPEEIIVWLNNGAGFEKHRCIGYDID